MSGEKLGTLRVSGTLDGLLKELLQRGGSDLLIAAGYPPAMRIHGMLVKTNHPLSDPDEVEGILSAILSDAEQEFFRQQQDMDFAYQIEIPGQGAFRFRANAFIQRFGCSLVFRSIPREIPTMAQLGLPDELTRLMDFHQGLVMVTGPTGSGKTSSVAALVDYCNRTRPQNIITLEDPIEFVHPIKKSLVVQRQVGLHVDSYNNALRAALREDPDVIVVGELRDLETISLCITAAETGHLVVATMNTMSGAQTVNRIINAFPPRQQSQVRIMLSESLRGVISQQLLARADGRGRVAAVEILITTGATSNLIRENKMHQVASIMQTGSRKGMRSMDHSLLELVQNRQVKVQEAIDRAHDRASFMQAASEFTGGQAT